jgi:two-component sensor histidine kinase
MNAQSVRIDNSRPVSVLPHEPALRSAQVRQLHEQSRPGIIAALIGAFIAAFALREQVPHLWLAGWLAVYVVVQAPRYHLMWTFPRACQSDEEISAWGWKFSAATLLSQLIWGSVGIIAFPPNSPIHQMILAIVLGGVAAAAAVVYAPLHECYAPSIIALLSPVSLRFLYEGGEHNIFMGCCVVILTVVLVLLDKRLNGVLIHNLILELDKNHLIESLAEEKSFTERLNRKLVGEIEERKRTEAALRESEQETRNSLKEKEVLLREVHHRVKNNLAVMSSLLRLQSRYTKDGLYREVFDDVQDRIRSIALAHESLYRSGNMEKLNIKTYVSILIDQLVTNTAHLGSPISLEKQIDEVSFGIETAVPLGFILTELVTNCLKHAFPGKRAGHILVCLKRKDDEVFELLVSDDGVGLPEEVVSGSRSFGLDLVDTMARQLTGRIEMARGVGTEVKLTFSAPAKQISESV